MTHGRLLRRPLFYRLVFLLPHELEHYVVYPYVICLYVTCPYVTCH